MSSDPRPGGGSDDRPMAREMSPRPRRTTLESFNEELSVLERPLADDVEYYDERPPSRWARAGSIGAVVALLGGAGLLLLLLLSSRGQPAIAAPAAPAPAKAPEPDAEKARGVANASASSTASPAPAEGSARSARPSSRARAKHHAPAHKKRVRSGAVKAAAPRHPAGR